MNLVSERVLFMRYLQSTVGGISYFCRGLDIIGTVVCTD